MSTETEKAKKAGLKNAEKATKPTGITDKSKNEELAVKFEEQLATGGAFAFFARFEKDKKGKPKVDNAGNEYYTCFFCQSRNVRGDNASPDADESLNDEALGWNSTNRIVRSLQRVLKSKFEEDAQKENPMFQVGIVPMAEYEVDGKTVELPSVYIKVEHGTTPNYDDQNPRQVKRDGVMCLITNMEGEPTFENTKPLKAKYSPTGELKATDKLIPSDEQRFLPIDEEEEEEEEEELED